MHLFYIIFISLANNLDNISVRIAYSLRGIKISIQKNLWISLITLIISTSFAYLGSSISLFLNERITSYISMLLLVMIGAWIILGEIKRHKKISKTNDAIKNSKNLFTLLDQPENADLDNSKDIDFKEATLLGLALSLNNIGGGLSAGMIGLNSLYVGLLSSAISFVALFAGNYLAKLFNRYNFGDKATITSGVILILIGIKQIL